LDLGCGHEAMSVGLARAGATVVGDPDEQWRDWRERVCNRRLHATGRFPGSRRAAGRGSGRRGGRGVTQVPSHHGARFIAVGNG
jgi:hypothetical protein